MRNKSIKLIQNKIINLKEQKECAINEMQAISITEQINKLKIDLKKGINSNKSILKEDIEISTLNRIKYPNKANSISFRIKRIKQSIKELEILEKSL